MERYHENTRVLHVGTEPPRGFYIPSKAGERYSPYQWEESSSVTMLNGEWEFRLFGSFEEAVRARTEEGDAKWGAITVPGCWQTQGYDVNQYTNIRYPIPVDPPYVPDRNPAGLYRREFTFPQKEVGKRVYLNFDGVDSCFYLWINGNFSGYSQVSHSSSEFEITEQIRGGRNRIEVLVLKWCDGTYLEDQDKLRMSGIFGDVYLLCRPQDHIRDFFLHTRISEDFAQIEVKLAYKGKGNPSAWAAIRDQNGNEAANGETVKDRIRFSVKDPILWNAERPYLYRLEIRYGEEQIVKYFGIRQVEIRNAVLLVNGTPIKLKGVNRHDSDPYTGYAISREQLLRDLVLMKRHNINAIRTSHYPNAPWAYDLYDRMGFYVICEADLEAHGNVLLYTGEPVLRESPRENLERLFFENPLFGRMMEDPQFEEAVLDRVRRCAEREKNAACRIMWSLGNESGFGQNLEKAAHWLKGFDPDTPIHYEGMVHQTPGREPDFSNIDVYSRMYPSPAVCRHYAEQQSLKKPFVCCEYMHSMGNGPGDIEDYWDVFYQYDILAGGFAWEWCDHAVYAGKRNGKPAFLYGGDFGERQHDGNFCVDGLVSPDRMVKQGLLEYKNVLRPIRARLTSRGPESVRVELTNHMDFLEAGQAVEAACEIWENGEKLREEVLELPALAPHGKAALEIKPGFSKVPSLKELRLLYRKKNAEKWADEGWLLGFDQLFVERDYGFLDFRQKAGPKKLWAEEQGEELFLSGDGFAYVFSLRNGQFRSICREGKELLDSPAEWNIWRAPTDNDQYEAETWKRAGYHLAAHKTYRAEWIQTEDGLEISLEEGLAAPGFQKAIHLSTVWTIDGAGIIRLSTKGRKSAGFPDLPRFGLRLFLKSGIDRIRYWGIGPGESYVDKRRAGMEGWYETSPEREYVDHIKPQEHGSHWGLRYLKIGDGTWDFVFQFSEPGSGQVLRYSQEQLEQAEHDFELKEEDRVILCLDYKQNGIGSNSCGPRLDRRYAFDEMEWEFGFCWTVRRERNDG